MEDTIDKFEKHRDAAHVQRVTQSPADAGVVVKPLEWKDYADDGYRSSLAKSVVGNFEAFQVGTDPARLELNARNKGVYPTIEEAKAAAQADYERRILSALTTPKPESVGDQCDKCHRRYTAVYNVPNDLWTKIAPKPETLGDYPEHQYGGLLCPDCATDAAKALGVNLVLATQPPTPASGEQMEVVAWRIGHKFEDDYIVWTYFDGSDEVNVEKAVPLVTLDAAQKALTAANERAERAERELTRRHEDLKDWKSAHRKEMGARAAAEALNTTLSEALEPFANLAVDEENGVEGVNMDDPFGKWLTVAQLVAARTALAALPAKQGGHSDEA